MKIQSPKSAEKSGLSPSHDALRRISKSGGSAKKSPLGPSPHGLNVSPGSAPKSGEARWMGSRLRKLRTSQASLALQSLNEPRESSAMFGAPLLAKAPGVNKPILSSLPDCPKLQALLARLKAEGRGGLSCVPTTSPGEQYTDYTGQESFTFCLPKKAVIKRIDIGAIVSLERTTALEAPRLLAILEAIDAKKAIPPIQVDADYRIDNGFHRYFISRLLGYTQIDVWISKS